ncbi:Outer membrane protein OmpA [Pseudarcicella hirudinis]|uniref:Outer membrane protein OmpA n=1 Tax=Pseudarcicella hirudinis TaxID=1079859 RepID=A0A1I5VAC4_9BACT|nr:OmpA family protein [Pseudarcicella hirudinis]SFQ04351.1 Outer membrane protein OmpA [Pseudarcicella hirudinis]
MNILAELKNLLNEDIVRKAANLTGEKEDKTKIALDGLVPTIVGGLMKRAANEAGAATLMNVIKKGNHDENNIEIVQKALTSIDNLKEFVPSGHNIISMLLPDKKSSIAAMISSYAGIHNSSATSLLAIVAPLVVGRLGKEVRTQNLDKESLANLLLTQKDYLLEETAESLQNKMIDVMGIDSFLSQELRSVSFPSASPIKATSTGSSIPPRQSESSLESKPTVTYSTKDYDEEGSGGFSLPKWVLPAVLTLAVLGAAGYFLATYDWSSVNSTSEPDSASLEQVTGAKIDTTSLSAVKKDSVKTDSAAIASTPKKVVGLDLPNGQKIDLEEGSFNFQFAKYLADSSSKPLKVFTIDNLNFELNSALLTQGSEKTVEDLSKIMLAYPKLQIKLIGYTENTGDTLANKKLSLKRTITVRTMLLKSGINLLRIDMEGKGPYNPIASNATPEGRDKNRRLELKVVHK